MYCLLLVHAWLNTLTNTLTNEPFCKVLPKNECHDNGPHYS